MVILVVLLGLLELIKQNILLMMTSLFTLTHFYKKSCGHRVDFEKNAMQRNEKKIGDDHDIY